MGGVKFGEPRKENGWRPGERMNEQTRETEKDDQAELGAPQVP